MERSLTIMCADPEATPGHVLYNVGVQVQTSGEANCDPAETMQVQSLLSAKFDTIVNTNPQFRDLFQLNTNFCDDEPTVPDQQTQPDESNGDESIDEETIDEESSEEEDDRRLELRVTAHHFSLQLARWGDGTCYMCNPFNSDRRKLQGGFVDDVGFFYQSSAAMEDTISTALTTELRNTFNNLGGHCLYNMDPSVQAYLVVAPDTTASPVDCQGTPSLYCCAPKANPADVCSKGSNPYCHASQTNCEICDGLWVDSLNPPTDCLGFWQPCKDGGTCCPPATCHELNPWYSQCLDQHY